MVQLGHTGHLAEWLPALVLMIPASIAGGIIHRRQTGRATVAAQDR
jgi:hypothetical protein